MSSGGHIRERRPGVWQVMYDAGPDPVTGKRRQRSRTFSGSRADAENLLTDIRQELDQGTWVDDGSIRVRDLAEVFMAGRGPRLRPTTVAWYEHKLKYVVEAMGHRKASQISGGTLTAFYGRLLQRGLSGTTVAGVHRATRAMFRAGVKWGYIKNDPTARAEPPLKSTKEMTTWSAGELRRFLEATVDDQWHMAWLLCAMTGLRRGELCGLEWSKVDLESGKLTISKTIVEVKGKVIESAPKTNSSRRTIKLDAVTVEALVAYRGRGGVTRMGRVITWEDGTPVNPEVLTRSFKRTVKRLGLPMIRLHDLRHGWASLALEAGVHIRVVADRLGHSTPSVTLNIYSHAADLADGDAAEAVAALIRRSGNRSGNARRDL